MYAAKGAGRRTYSFFDTAMEQQSNQRREMEAYFLAALARMPQASGIALGFDRLVMLAAGATRIEQVIWTPVTGR